MPAPPGVGQRGLSSCRDVRFKFSFVGMTLQWVHLERPELAAILRARALAVLCCVPMAAKSCAAEAPAVSAFRNNSPAALTASPKNKSDRLALSLLVLVLVFPRSSHSGVPEASHHGC